MKPSLFRNRLVAILGLWVMTIAAYWPVTRAGFVEYDDTDYVTENLKIQDGLTPQAIKWAFSSGHAANWHPLTWMSHMLDIQLYDLRPVGHHVTNLVLHAVNVALLFIVLLQMTDAFWCSVLVAALFAVHPAHVESVAWVSERKDVLSTLFGLLALWAYAKYAAARLRAATNVSVHYVLALFFFALSLMSKPMLVTLPFLLLLIDFWPLRRFPAPVSRLKRAGPLVLEKFPFFVLTIASCVVTFFVQRAGGATVSTHEFSLGARAANVLVSYVRYLGELVWPVRLGVFYPRPESWPPWQVAASALVLLVLTAWVLKLIYRQSYLAVGWFWFLGALVPVIGLVQVGEQAMADRYTYIPSVGIFIAVAWSLADIARRGAQLRILFGAASVAALGVFSFLTWRQSMTWQNTETLFRQGISVVKDNFMAEEALASALSNAGQLQEAELHCLEALRIRPHFPEANSTYAIVLVRQGRAAEARERINEVLRNNPADASAHFTLAQACALAGEFAEAVRQYEAGLRLKPDNADGLNNLAWIRAANADPALRDGAEAVRLATQACELTRYRRPLMVGTLAAAYAEAGRFPEAVTMARKAQELAASAGKPEIAQKNAELLELYQAGKPCHEPPPANPVAPANP